jgi:hypothetical protein
MVKFVHESMQICCWKLNLEFIMLLLSKTIQFRNEIGDLAHAPVIRELVFSVASELEYMAIFVGTAGK